MIYSNTGFKLKSNLYLLGAGKQLVSLPYKNPYVDANSLFTDIPFCTEISRWLPTSHILQTWDGSSGTNFDIIPGEAYYISVSQDTEWLVVGSHDPELTLTIIGLGTSNLISLPPHLVASTVDELFTEITSCVEISRWNHTLDSFDTYTGGFLDTIWDITPGVGILVKIDSGISSVNWTPQTY